MLTDTARVPSLLEQLATELERPRPITAQVLNHLIATYGVDRTRVAEFLIERMPALEDFEVELILSPLFTPTLRDQAVFAELLGPEPVARDIWPELIQQLAQRPTLARLITPESRTLELTLRPVVLERYLHRLRLDGSIPRPLFERIQTRVPEPDRPMLKAIARRAIWTQHNCLEILQTWLDAALAQQPFPLQDTIELLRLVETYEPVDVAALSAFLPHWREVLQQEIRDAALPSPFFNERVRDLHGSARDQRRPDTSRAAAKQQELALIERLARVFDR